MDVPLWPEVEAEITRRATNAGKAPAEVIQDLIATALDEEARFLAAAALGFAELDAGQFVTHEDVGHPSSDDSARCPRFGGSQSR
jgi:predicted transcriptional regulator